MSLIKFFMFKNARERRDLIMSEIQALKYMAILAD